MMKENKIWCPDCLEDVEPDHSCHLFYNPLNSLNYDNVSRILNCSVSDINYKEGIAQLTDEELIYCFENENRKTGKTLLAREAKKRKILLT